MNWIEVMRLIITLWPLIEQLIKAIEDSQEREDVANRATNVVASLLNGTLSSKNPLDVAVALAGPFKKKAA